MEPPKKIALLEKFKIENTKLLPVNYNFIFLANDAGLESSDLKEINHISITKNINVPDYNTEYFTVHGFYKHISKIIKFSDK